MPISIETIRAILKETEITYQHTQTWKESNAPEYEVKKRIKALHQNPPKDGRVICLDEFGPIDIQPFPGMGRFKKEKPGRLPATYHRYHGVRHLLAAVDMKDDKLYGRSTLFSQPRL